MKILRLVPKSRNDLLEKLEEHVGKRKYWLHDRIGGDGWSVQPLPGYYKVQIDNDNLATFIALLIDHETIH